MARCGVRVMVRGCFWARGVVYVIEEMMLS